MHKLCPPAKELGKVIFLLHLLSAAIFTNINPIQVSVFSITEVDAVVAELTYNLLISECLDRVLQ